MRWTSRSRGSEWEQSAADWYQQSGYSIVSRNYTIKWGEIDLIVHGRWMLVFAEVKVVDGLHDFTWIITPFKRRSLQRAIFHYISRHNSLLSWRVDVVLVAWDRVVHHYPYISL
jgi:putative endonuclease